MSIGSFRFYNVLLACFLLAACTVKGEQCGSDISVFANRIPLATDREEIATAQTALRNLIKKCGPTSRRIKVVTMNADDLGLLILADDNNGVLQAVERGAEPRQAFKFDDLGFSMTAMHVAALYSTSEMIPALTSSGIDPNAPASDGNPPLFYAASNMHDPCEMGNALIEHGARLDVMDGTGAAMRNVLLAEAPEFLRCIE